MRETGSRDYRLTRYAAKTHWLITGGWDTVE